MLKYLLAVALVNIRLLAITISDPISLPQKNICKFDLAANEQGDVALVFVEPESNDNAYNLYSVHRYHQNTWQAPQNFKHNQGDVKQIKCSLDSAGHIRFDLEDEDLGTVIGWENSPNNWRFLEVCENLFDPDTTALKSCLTLDNQLIFLAQARNESKYQFFTQFIGFTCDLNGKCYKPKVFYQETKDDIKDDLRSALLAFGRIAIGSHPQEGAFLAWGESVDDAPLLALKPASWKIEGASWNGVTWEKKSLASVSDTCLSQLQVAVGPKQQRSVFWIGKEGIRALTQMSNQAAELATIGQVHISPNIIPPPAFDKEGNLLLVWSTLNEQGRDVIRAVYKPYNQPWQPSVDLKVFPEGIYCEDLQMQVDAKGNYYLVWAEDNNDSYSIHAGIFSTEKGSLSSESLVSPKNQDCYHPIFRLTGPETGVIAWQQDEKVQVADISFCCERSSS